MSESEPDDEGKSGPVIAPADSLKGQLQRGRGAGFLAALAEPPERLWPLLADIIAHDPRWDSQVERRGGMYAELILASRMPIDLIEVLVRAIDSPDRRYNEFLPFEVVTELAKRGEPRSFGLLRDLVRNARDWSSPFDVLEEIGTPKALEGLDEVLISRALDDDDLGWVLPWGKADGPWPEWRRKHPRIDAALRAREAANAREAAATAGLEGHSIEELLHSGVTDYGALRSRIAETVRLSDLHVIVRHLDPSILPACQRALSALKHIPGAETLAALRTFAEANPDLRLGCVGWATQAFEAQPAALALELGREWFDHPNWRFSTWGENILAAHATLEDIPLLERALSGCWADPEESYRACSVLEAFCRLPGAGRFPDIERAFIEAHYSRVRDDAAHAMHVTDPRTFAERFAYECLWDCRESVQELGIAAVDLSLPGARERVETLASARFEDRDVQRAARLRLGIELSG